MENCMCYRIMFLSPSWKRMILSGLKQHKSFFFLNFEHKNKQNFIFKEFSLNCLCVTSKLIWLFQLHLRLFFSLKQLKNEKIAYFSKSCCRFLRQHKLFSFWIWSNLLKTLISSGGTLLLSQLIVTFKLQNLVKKLILSGRSLRLSKLIVTFKLQFLQN